MSESIEVQIARLDERFKAILTMLEENGDNKRELHRWMGSVDATMERMMLRMESVEKSLASSAPTIGEFISLKHKIIGAGALGKWIWTVAVALLGWAYGAREQIADLFK